MRKTPYWLSFGITYGYNQYFLDNPIAENLVFSVFGWWLLGLLVIALAVFISAIANTGSIVLLGTGGAFLILYLVGLLPKVGAYSLQC